MGKRPCRFFIIKGVFVKNHKVGAVVILAGVGLLLLASRKVNADVPYYLSPSSGDRARDGTFYDQAPVGGLAESLNLDLRDIFGSFYSGGLSPWGDELIKRQNPNYDPDRVIPYDSYKTTSGVSQSFFSDAGDWLASVSGTVAGVVSLPSGVGQNNPLNLSKSAIGWEGKRKVRVKGNGFEEFINPWYGIRAGAMDIKNSQKNNGNKTIRAIVFDHDKTPKLSSGKYIQDEYAKTVGERLGVSPDVYFDIVSNWVNLRNLVKQMIKFECRNYEYLDQEMFSDACMAAVDLHKCPPKWEGEWLPKTAMSILPSFENYA